MRYDYIAGILLNTSLNDSKGIQIKLSVLQVAWMKTFVLSFPHHHELFFHIIMRFLSFQLPFLVAVFSINLLWASSCAGQLYVVFLLKYVDLSKQAFVISVLHCTKNKMSSSLILSLQNTLITSCFSITALTCFLVLSYPILDTISRKSTRSSSSCFKYATLAPAYFCDYSTQYSIVERCSRHVMFFSCPLYATSSFHHLHSSHHRFIFPS